MSETDFVPPQVTEIKEQETQDLLSTSYNELLKNLNVDPESLPPEYVKSKEKPYSKSQQILIEKLCMAGTPWRTHEIADFLSKVARHKESLSDALYFVSQLPSLTKKIDTREKKIMAREETEKELNRRRAKEDALALREKNEARDKLMTRAGWSRFVSLCLSSLGREKTPEENRRVAAYTFTDTRIFEGLPTDDNALIDAIKEAANKGVPLKDSSGKLQDVKLPFYQYDGNDTNDTTVQMVDARDENILLPNGPTDVLVIKCRLGQVVDIPINIHKHPLIVYVAEDTSQIKGESDVSESRTVVSIKTAHEAGDGIHIGVLQGRIRDKLGLSDVKILSKDKLKEYSEWNSNIAKPETEYSGDYVPENITIENEKIKKYVEELNKKLKESGIVDEESKITTNEALTLISEDILASRTGHYEEMGHLAYVPQIEERLHHLRGKGILSMNQLVGLLDKGVHTDEDREKIMGHITNLRVQRREAPDGSNNNMRFLKAASRYPHRIQRTFNYVANKYWQGGMEQIIGKHMESIVPNKLKKSFISGFTEEENQKLVDKAKKLGDKNYLYFSFGIGIANPALMDIQTGAVTISPTQDSDITIIDENKEGEFEGKKKKEYHGVTTFSLKYIREKH